jgi:hypothetical protein
MWVGPSFKRMLLGGRLLVQLFEEYVDDLRGKMIY